jgi:hypothetical protein
MENTSKTDTAKAEPKLLAAKEATTTLCIMPSEGARETDPAHQRKGKKPLLYDITAEERSSVIINMAKARGLVHVHILAIGVFLSLLTIPSKQLVNYMLKVWRIKGVIETHELANKRFILEFAEEGDYEHITRGGPWRYQNNAVLIHALKDSENTEMVPFETVPMWVQFARIPFYLLSK